MIPSAEEAAKLWLLEALVAPTPATDAAIDRFTAADWAVIRHCVGQHRLRPMLFALMRDRWTVRPIPESFRANCQQSYYRTLGRQFERRTLLIEVSRAFTAAGIDHAVLKGGALLGGVYPDAALRPIRDLDLLIRPADIARASQLLIGQHNCIPQSQLTGTVPEDYSIHKHAEPLWHQGCKVPIELHVRLVDKPRRGKGGLLFDPERLLARAVPRQLGGQALPCLAWPETLLHLIAHSVHDHQLNNGPLLLTDVLGIVRSGAVDWDEFWVLAEEGGWTGAARLTGDLLEQLTGDNLNRFGSPPSAPTPEPVLHAAAIMLLQECSVETGISGWSRLQARPSLAALLGRLRLRASKGASSEHAPGLWRRLGGMFRVLRSATARREIARSGAVYRWLERGSGPA